MALWQFHNQTKSEDLLTNLIYRLSHFTLIVKWANEVLQPTPEAGAFFAFAISEQNFAFAKSSLASGAGELGYIDIGFSSKGIALIVWYTERSENIRIIGCRKATRSERKTSEKKYAQF